MKALREMLHPHRHLLLSVALGCLGGTASAVAGDATGTWKAEFDTQIGRQKYTYTQARAVGEIAKEEVVAKNVDVDVSAARLC
jgi:hypothetical protein